MYMYANRDRTNSSIARVKRDLEHIRTKIDEEWSQIGDINHTSPGPTTSSPQLNQDLEGGHLEAIRKYTRKAETLESHLEELKRSSGMGFEKSYIRAASKCRSLCSAMQARLPRELRNMVYQAVLINPQSGMPIYTVGDDRDYLVTQSKKDVSSCVHPDPRKEGRWFNKDFVGLATLPEIIEVWWEKSTFIITSLRQEETHGFLTSDLWGVGVLGCSHIRQVVINILHIPYGKTELDNPFRRLDLKPLSHQIHQSKLKSKPNVGPEDASDVGSSQSSRYWTGNVRISYVLEEDVHMHFNDASELSSLFAEGAPKMLRKLAEIVKITRGIELVCCFSKEPWNHCVIQVGERHLGITNEDCQQELKLSPIGVLNSIRIVLLTPHINRWICGKPNPYYRGPWGRVRRLLENLGIRK